MAPTTRRAAAAAAAAAPRTAKARPLPIPGKSQPRIAKPPKKPSLSSAARPSDPAPPPASTEPAELPSLPTLTPPFASLLQQAQAHLVAAAPAMAVLIARNPDCPVFTPEWLAEEVDPFESLASALISQQVSGAAARSIKAKFISLFADQLGGAAFPTPAMVPAVAEADLRAAGLSQRKAEYVQGLAAAFNSGEVTAASLRAAPDADVVAQLTRIRGIGVWTAEMFLIFGLRRSDVFSTGDLGIQRGMAAFLGRNVRALKSAKRGAESNKKWKYLSEDEMLRESARFEPYRTLFCWYMWRCEGTDVDAMGDSKKTELVEA